MKWRQQYHVGVDSMLQGRRRGVAGFSGLVYFVERAIFASNYRQLSVSVFFATSLCWRVK